MAKEEKKPDPAMPGNQADAFESAVGEVFGGVYPPLKLNIGECSPRLRFERMQKIPVKEDDGTTKLIESPIAINTVDGNQRFSLPIGAVFRKHWDEAKPNVGDEFLVKRYDDAVKKSGRGAGKPFHVYGIKVVKRIPVDVAPAAPQT